MATELSGSESGIKITDSTEIFQRPPALPGVEATTQQSAAEQNSAPASEPDEQEAEEQPEEARKSRFLLLNAVPSWLVSLVVHSVGLMVLALIMLPLTEKKQLSHGEPWGGERPGRRVRAGRI